MANVAYTLSVRGVVLPVTQTMLQNAPDSFLSRIAHHLHGGGLGVAQDAEGRVLLDHDPVFVQYTLSYLESLAMPDYPSPLAPLLMKSFSFLGIAWPGGDAEVLLGAIKDGDLRRVRALLALPDLAPSREHVEAAIKLSRWTQVSRAS